MLHGALLALFPACAFAGQQVALVEESNPGDCGTGPASVTAFQGHLYFQAQSGSAGRELMKYDGSRVSLAADSGEGFGLEFYRVLSPSGPGIPNGGFETGGLLPWILTGAGAVVTDGAFDPPLAPASGEHMGYITTLNNEGAEDFGYYDDSPDIDRDGERESEYSSLRITFTTAVPGTVSVDLNFLTDELPAGEADLFGLADHFTHTFPVWSGAVFTGDGALSGSVDGVVYRVEGAGDLMDFTDQIVEVVPAFDAGLPPLDAGWSHRTFCLSRPVSESPSGFVRVSITPAP